LARVGLRVETLHPDVAGLTIVWRPNHDTQYKVAPFQPNRPENGAASPLARMRETSKEVRVSHCQSGSGMRSDLDPFASDKESLTGWPSRGYLLMARSMQRLGRRQSHEALRQPHFMRCGV
jgi:hypothetical protein